MIPVGYTAKQVVSRPEWLQAEQVVDIYSVSTCLSKDFTGGSGWWEVNGYWFFDSPALIQQAAHENEIALDGMSLFYYESYEREFDGIQNKWLPVTPNAAFATQVVLPVQPRLEGFDVVTFSTGTSPECSPLSCNHLASEIATNAHCLLPSLEQARHLLENGAFTHSEPGPYRVFAVYSVAWPSPLTLSSPPQRYIL